MDGPIFSTVAGAHASVPKTKPLDEFEHLTTKAQLFSTVAGAHASVPKTKPPDEFEHLTTKA